MQVARPHLPPALCLLLVVGSTLSIAGSGREEKNERPARVSPIQVFQGDLKRLEPHLDFTGFTSIQIENDEPDRFLTIRVDLDKDGKTIPIQESMRELSRGEAEVSVSLKSASDPHDGKEKYQVIIAERYPTAESSRRVFVESPTFVDHYESIDRISQPIDLRLGESKTFFNLSSRPKGTFDFRQAPKYSLRFLVKLDNRSTIERLNNNRSGAEQGKSSGGPDTEPVKTKKR